jgi:hypothetical protein
MDHGVTCICIPLTMVLDGLLALRCLSMLARHPLLASLCHPMLCTIQEKLNGTHILIASINGYLKAVSV